MFAKILRIVAKWYGNLTSEEVLPQIFEDAVYAWKTGEFEGVRVFQVEDPGISVEVPQQGREEVPAEEVDAGVRQGEERPEAAQDVERAGIRIDLSRIGGQ